MFDKLFGEAKGIFNAITMLDIIVSIIYILIGVLFFTNPEGNNTFVSIVTGFLLIINGGSAMFSYFRRGSIELYNYNLIVGIALFILGVIAMFLGKVLSIALGLYFIVAGAQKISYSFLLKKFNENSWIFNLVVGILFIILGATAFFTDGEKVIEVAGICLLGYGVMNLVSTILLRKRSKYFIA